MTATTPAEQLLIDIFGKQKEDVMIETTKFARKPFYVDGVQVTEENMEAVAEWCMGTVCTNDDGTKFIKVRVHRPMNERQTKAFVEDHVLYAGTGFKVYPPRAFEKSFEEVVEQEGAVSHNVFEQAAEPEEKVGVTPLKTS